MPNQNARTSRQTPEDNAKVLPDLFVASWGPKHILNSTLLSILRNFNVNGLWKLFLPQPPCIVCVKLRGILSYKSNEILVTCDVTPHPEGTTITGSLERFPFLCSAMEKNYSKEIEYS